MRTQNGSLNQLDPDSEPLAHGTYPRLSPPQPSASCWDSFLQPIFPIRQVQPAKQRVRRLQLHRTTRVVFLEDGGFGDILPISGFELQVRQDVTLQLFRRREKQGLHRLRAVLLRATVHVACEGAWVR